MPESDAESAKRLHHRSWITRRALESGTLAAGVFVLYAGMYMLVGFELTVISMLAVILLAVIES